MSAPEPVDPVPYLSAVPAAPLAPPLEAALGPYLAERLGDRAWSGAVSQLPDEAVGGAPAGLSGVALQLPADVPQVSPVWGDAEALALLIAGFFEHDAVWRLQRDERPAFTLQLLRPGQEPRELMRIVDAEPPVDDLRSALRDALAG